MNWSIAAAASWLTVGLTPNCDMDSAISFNVSSLACSMRAHMAAAAIAGTRMPTPLTGEVAVTVHIYRPRKTGDLDNRLKALLDSLTGCIWRDDKQVVEMHVYRRDDRDNPRAVVTVREVAPAPMTVPQARAVLAIAGGAR
jgi:hypothetical protein